MVNPDLCQAKRAHRLLSYTMSLAHSAKRTIFIAKFSAGLTRPSKCRQYSFRTGRLRQCDICCRAATVAQSAEHLQAWADQREKQLENCRVEASKDTALLLTSTSARPGQCLLSVPDSSWISLQVVAKSSIGPSVASLEPWLQLALFVLSGLQDSAWSRYLLSLPTSLDVPLLWEEDELDLLEGTQLLSTVLGYR